MFLRPTVLNRLMKEAYKTGLRVSRDKEDWVHLEGEYWQVDVKKKYIGKKAMGDLIALIGELPEKGTGFTATKEGNQMEIVPEAGIKDISDFSGTLEITDMLLVGDGGTLQRLLQDTETGMIYPVNNVFIDIVNNGEIKEDAGEYAVYVLNYHPQRGILWQNNVCRLRAPFRRDKKNGSILETIAGADITRREEL